MKQLLLVLLAIVLLQNAYAQKTDLPSFRLTVNGGYSLRLGKVSSQYTGESNDYMKKLKSGFNIGADAIYYFREKMGVGLKYSRFQASNSAVIPVMTGSGEMRTNVSDKIGINFFAATFATRIFNAAGTNAFYANVALGYLGFRDNGQVYLNKMVLTGGSLGIGWDVGYDFRITRLLSAGAQVSLITGQMTSFVKEDASSRVTVTLPEGQRENLSHLNISGGLRLNL